MIMQWTWLMKEKILTLKKQLWGLMEHLKRSELKEDQRMTCMDETINALSALKHTYHTQPFTHTWKPNIQLGLMENSYCLIQEEVVGDQRRMQVELQLLIQNLKITLKRLIKEVVQLMFSIHSKKLLKRYLKTFGMTKISSTNQFTWLLKIKKNPSRKSLRIRNKSSKNNMTNICKTLRVIQSTKHWWRIPTWILTSLNAKTLSTWLTLTSIFLKMRMCLR